MIKDSGNRREFSTGAVRDIEEGKGRCDLMPLVVAAQVQGIKNGEWDHILYNVGKFVEEGSRDYLWLQVALKLFAEQAYSGNVATMLLEVSKHFEEGAKKYGENNWQKGIPPKCYIDSAVRHYLKWLRGDEDEPHDRAFVWNLMCCIWEVERRDRSE